MTDYKVFKPTQPYEEKLNTPIIQQKDYYPSWIEFASQKYEQIIKSVYNTSASSTIYTCPANFILYVTNVWLNTHFNGNAVAGTAGAINLLDVAGVNFVYKFLASSILLGTASDNSMTISYNMPIKVNPGESIRVSSGVNTSLSGGFVGFLVPFSP